MMCFQQDHGWAVHETQRQWLGGGARTLKQETRLLLSASTCSSTEYCVVEPAVDSRKGAIRTWSEVLAQWLAALLEMVLQELATIGGDVVSLNNTSWRCRFRACGKGASHRADTWSKSSRLQEGPVLSVFVHANMGPLQMLYVPDVSRPCCLETAVVWL